VWKKRTINKDRQEKCQQSTDGNVRREKQQSKEIAIGRPRLKWLDDVEADIKAAGVKRWRIKARAKLKGP
jgi:hypothetical protein